MKNIVKSNKFIEAHNFSVNATNQEEYRKFQIHKSFIKETYKNSNYVDLPDKMGQELIKFKNINFVEPIDPQVRIIVGKKLIQTTQSLKIRNLEKWRRVKDQSVKNSSWKWKKMTAIISLKPTFIFVIHIFDKGTGKKLEDYSGSHIDFKIAFRLLETLEISHAKHFKTAIQIDERRLSEKEKLKFDLTKYVFIKSWQKQFDYSFLLTRWFLENEEFNRPDDQSWDRYSSFSDST